MREVAGDINVGSKRHVRKDTFMGKHGNEKHVQWDRHNKAGTDGRRAIQAIHTSRNILPFSKESILLDIQRQNFAGKPCHIAQIKDGKISYKAHVFH